MSVYIHPLSQWHNWTIRYLLAVLSIGHRCIIAEEKLPVEKLNSNHSEDKKKENVDNENIKNVLQWDHHAVKHSFQSGNSVDHLQWSQHSKQLHRLQFSSSRRPPENYIWLKIFEMKDMKWKILIDAIDLLEIEWENCTAYDRDIHHIPNIPGHRNYQYRIWRNVQYFYLK